MQIVNTYKYITCIYKYIVIVSNLPISLIYIHVVTYSTRGAEYPYCWFLLSLVDTRRRVSPLFPEWWDPSHGTPASYRQ